MLTGSISKAFDAAFEEDDQFSSLISAIERFR
jgi:hypothetical protein